MVLVRVSYHTILPLSEPYLGPSIHYACPTKSSMPSIQVYISRLYDYRYERRLGDMLPAAIYSRWLDKRLTGQFCLDLYGSWILYNYNEKQRALNFTSVRRVADIPLIRSTPFGSGDLNIHSWLIYK
jgi:hypothetical protein